MTDQESRLRHNEESRKRTIELARGRINKGDTWLEGRKMWVVGRNTKLFFAGDCVFGEFKNGAGGV